MSESDEKWLKVTVSDCKRLEKTESDQSELLRLDRVRLDFLSETLSPAQNGLSKKLADYAFSYLNSVKNKFVSKILSLLYSLSQVQS